MSCPDCGSTNFTGSHGCNPIDVAYYRYAKLRAKYEKAVAFIGELEHTYDLCEFRSFVEACTACKGRELLKELNKELNDE